MDRKLARVLTLIIILLVVAGCDGNRTDSPTAGPSDNSPADEAQEEAESEEVAPEDVAPEVSESEVEEAATAAPASEEPAGEALVEGSLQGFTLAEVGFKTPESVLYEPEADVYLVSNINGSPSAVDGNGFIARLAPAGQLLELKWIDGASEGVTLNAPKGMAVTGEELWVSDITAVRIFDRVSGAPLGEVSVGGASFLNDVVAAPDGAIWVSDSNTGTLHRIAPDRTVEEMATIDGINGVAFADGTPLVTSGTSILEVGADGGTSERAAVPTGSLDGLVVLPDGRLAVSSWAGSNVYIIGDDEAVELVSGINGPADIGYDGSRAYILVPHFREDTVQAVPVP